MRGSVVAARRVPAARDVRARLRSGPRWRPSWRARLADAYERSLYAAVVGGLTYELVVTRLESGGPDGPAGGATWATPVWLSAIAAIVLAKCLVGVGPVVAGPSRVAWLLTSPVDRRGLLLPGLGAVAGLGLAVGALWPVVLLGVVGPVVEFTAPLLLTSAAAGVTVAAAAVVVQRTRWRRGAVQARLGAALGVAVLGLLVTTVLGPPADGPVEPRSWASEPTAGLAVLLAGSAVVAALGSLDRIRRDALTAGSDLLPATAVSLSSFEFALLGAILAERRARAIGRVRSCRLRGSRTVVLVTADVLRAVRNRNALLVWVASMPLPVIVDLGPATGLAPGLHLVVAFLATDRLAGGLRFVCRSEAVRRMLGVPTPALHAAHLVVPAVGAAVWCGVTLALVPDLTAVNALVSAVGAVAVVHRIATRPPLDHSAPVHDLGALGSAPVGLIIQLARGPALLVVLAWIQVALLG